MPLTSAPLPPNYHSLSNLQDLSRHLNQPGVDGKANLRAVWSKEYGTWILYTSKKGRGTGFKERLGIVDHRRRNAQKVLRLLADKSRTDDKLPVADSARKLVKDKPDEKPADISVEAFRKKMAFQDPVGAVNKDIEVWNNENTGYRHRIESLAKAVEVAGERAMAATKRDEIASARADLATAYQALQDERRRHDKWYVEGAGSAVGVAPRAGLDPLLKRANIPHDGLKQDKAAQLRGTLHDISGKAGDVKAVGKKIDDAYANWKMRLHVRGIELSGDAQAADKVFDIMQDQVQKLNKLAGTLQVELKLAKTQSLIAELNDPQSNRSRNLAANREQIATEIHSNDLRLNKIPAYRERIASQVIELKRAVPPEMRADPRFADLVAQMDRCQQQHQRTMDQGENLLKACNALIDAKLAALS